MSAFDDNFAESAAPQLLEQQGDPATLLTPEGAATAISLIVADESEEESADRRGVARVMRRTVLIDRTTAASITRDHRIAFGGVTWSVLEVERPGGGLVTVRLGRSTLLERSHGDRRLRGGL